MAVPRLHPKIRERVVARASATGLAEFIIAPPDQQDTILHDARFQSAYVSPKYSDALRIIKSYCCDIKRDRTNIERGREVLRKRATSGDLRPSAKEECLRCVEAIDRFEAGINVFGANANSFFAPEVFAPLEINGLTLSVQPDLIAGSSWPPSAGERVGVTWIRPQKRPNPDEAKTDEKKNERANYRRELARYVLVMSWLLLKSNGLDEAQIDTKKMSFWDLRLKEAVPFPSDRISRIRRIEAASGQIARLWGTILPKPADLV